MEESGDFTLNLPCDCFLEIIKYIIADCELNKEFEYDIFKKYNDLMNFVLAHNLFLELFAAHHKKLYQVLELGLERRTTKLLIDLRVNKLSNQNRNLFWRSYLHSIREGSSFKADLYFGHYGKNMENYAEVNVEGILSYPEKLNLNGNITSQALVDICVSLPNLKKLSVGSIKISGSISDIAPHCGNLEMLSVQFNAGDDVAKFAPLAQLPNLKTFTIAGIHKSGSQLIFFNDLTKLHRPKSLPPLALTIEDDIVDSNTPVTFAALDSLGYLHIQDSYAVFDGNRNARLRAVYEVNEAPQGGSSKKESVATITVGEFVDLKFDSSREELILNIAKNSDIGQMGSLSMLPKTSYLVIKSRSGEYIKHTSLATFFRSIVAKETFLLISCNIKNMFLDRSEFMELSKLKSIRFLKCSFSDCYSVRFLDQLTNLQHMEIFVDEYLDSKTSLLVLKLLNANQMTAKLNFKNVNITLLKGEQNLDIFLKIGCKAEVLSPLAQLNGITTLQIKGHPEKESLNGLFEAFATSNISTIEELDISKLGDIFFNSVSKVSEIQSIKKLSCDLVDLTGVEKLANLDKLQELNIKTNKFGTLSSLFTSLAAKNKIQCIRIPNGTLSPKEILEVSRIKSLKVLECRFSDMEDQQSLSELANSSIEELIVSPISYRLHTEQSVHKLVSAFSSNGIIRLQRLEIKGKALDISETTEISLLPVIISLQIASSDSLRSLARNPLCKLQSLELCFSVGLSEIEFLFQFETLQSLKCALRDEKGVAVLANIKGLKELTIVEAEGSLSELYKTFADESLTILEKLHTQIISSQEICEISQIKSLAELNIDCKCACDNLSDLCQLNELKSLRIAEKDKSAVKIDNVLPIFKKCQKLDCVTFELYDGCSEAPKIAKEVNTILKSIRDPALRRPLKLHIQSIDRNIEVMETEYLRVSHSRIRRRLLSHYLVRRGRTNCFRDCRRTSPSLGCVRP
ncbi:uncharacterized protein LOC119561070 isoform X1 [Drosophila subpulchrella]|uniref:uncharacterized protein LOC119561070 isoform X1 n=1 Tax=Drosophila subpulchrella TaxID=1486046 RepID=UPI0018A15C80|nr:uncharacterized protein LOC119561070 isoform X1 [Drosophila subpulchrella]